jgi:hypothetical protein
MPALVSFQDKKFKNPFYLYVLILRSKKITILSIREEEMKILAISPAREFKKKKDQTKTGFFESAENFGMRKNLFHSHFSARTDQVEKKSRKKNDNIF